MAQLRLLLFFLTPAYLDAVDGVLQELRHLLLDVLQCHVLHEDLVHQLLLLV